jgi:hypothetical protein
MPKITLFDAETIGVDLKSNPLFLGKRKLHAATNLVFDEGTVKTRPGFTYTAFGCSGIFQGAAEFFPKKGLSTATFSEINGGIAVAVGGKLYFNGRRVVGIEFPCHGNVNLFQAENYLVVQHEESETYWWDGVNLPVKSPGMQEPDWNDPDTGFVELETRVPVADIPNCDVTTEVAVTFNVVNAANESVIPGASVTLFRNSLKAYAGFTGERGTWSVEPVSREYTYSVSREGFTSLTDVALTVTGQIAERVFEECMPPQIITNGDMTVNVRLMPLEPEGCFSITMTYGESDSAVVMTVENNSEESKQILSIVSEATLTTSPSLPLTIAPGTSEDILITSLTPLPSISFALLTTCGNGGVEELEFPLYEDPRAYAFSFFVESDVTGAFGGGEGEDLRPVLSVIADGLLGTLTTFSSTDTESATYTGIFAERGHTFTVSVPTYPGTDISGRTLGGSIFNSGPDNMEVTYLGDVAVVASGDSYALPSLSQSGETTYTGTTYSLTVN